MKSNGFGRGLGVVLSVVLAIASMGCNEDESEKKTGGSAAPERGFQITTPDIVITPYQEIAYCYYFRTPNLETLAIKRWRPKMPAELKQLSLVTFPTELEPPGRVSAVNCPLINVNNGSELPTVLYLANHENDEMTFPSNDGTGKAVAQSLPANTPVIMRMHFLNTASTPVTLRAVLDAFAYEAGVAFTPASTYITYGGGINIAPLSAATFSKTCTVPAGLTFFRTSMYTHKQGVHTYLKDGTSGSVVYENTDWENPIVKNWSAPSFHTFPNGSLTYQCDYVNPTNRTIRSGISTATDENCVSINYFFPATATDGHSPLCYDSGFFP